MSALSLQTVLDFVDSDKFMELTYNTINTSVEPNMSFDPSICHVMGNFKRAIVLSVGARMANVAVFDKYYVENETDHVDLAEAHANDNELTREDDNDVYELEPYYRDAITLYELIIPWMPK